MDPFLAAKRVPQLAERAMRRAVVGAILHRRMTPHALVNDALMRFEDAVVHVAVTGVRPALLFAERDRVVRELRAFIDGRLAGRLAQMRPDRIVATGKAAAPFDAILRARSGRLFGLVVRRLSRGSERLAQFRRILRAAEGGTIPLDGVVVYDFTTARIRTIHCHSHAKLQAA